MKGSWQMSRRKLLTAAMTVPILRSRKARAGGLLIVKGAPPPPPVNITVPTISGTAQVGQVLASTTGTWVNSPTSYAYQWKSAGSNATGGGATTANYTAVTADIGNTLTVSVIATNASGSSTAATSAATAAVVASGGGYADGLAGAPAGTAQYPTLLNSYGVNRPPWNVSGVDYHVGIPSGTTLTDWRNISAANVNVQTSTGQITVSATYTFNNIDFSLGISAWVYSNTSGITVTFQNCKFSGSNSYTYSILDQGGASLIITNCEFNGLDMSILASHVGYRGNVTSTYSRYLNTKQHYFECVRTADFPGQATTIFRYNIFDDARASPGAHPNYLQTTNTISADMKVIIEFNLTYQFTYLTPGGEGFQVQPYGGVSYTDPILTNNTMIAVMDGANPTKSYIFRGAFPSDPCIGTGLNNYNYFDPSGTISGTSVGAYYPGSTVPASGWSSTGNINMIDGTIITPA